jgi:hypothetical protein
MASLLVHNVYFTLNESTPAAREKLLAACRKYLTGHAGVAYFAIGTLCAELDRPVNDLDYDVGLHMVFKSKADHDAYQVAQRHLDFIEENKTSWKKVRVFDTVAENA